MIKSINLPEIGENVESGVVVSVPIKPNDTVAVDETVIELETDKALVEIPSPFNGRVMQVLAKPGIVMKVGDVIARIETWNRASKEKSSATSPGQGTGLVASAFSDMKSHVRQALSRLEAADNRTRSKAPKLPDFSRWGKIEKKEMGTVRRLTARNTANSWTIIPHVTQFDETDITRLLAFIENEEKKKAGTESVPTLTAIITRTCADALGRFPQFNASIDISSNQIIYKRYIHIGIATNTPRGLLVPVIRNVDEKKVGELATEITNLTHRARNKKIKPDELEGGTFSISNQGSFGGVGFTPIVYWPQAAILGVSRFAVKPVFRNHRFEPRTVLPLSLSYDHRIIDGADAAKFLRWICKALEHNEPSSHD